MNCFVVVCAKLICSAFALLRGSLLLCLPAVILFYLSILCNLAWVLARVKLYIVIALQTIKDVLCWRFTHINSAKLQRLVNLDQKDLLFGRTCYRKYLLDDEITVLAIHKV